MKPLRRIEVLRVTQCSDPLLWYAPLIGQYVPALGLDQASGWKSKERTGYTNFVKPLDAERITVFAPTDQVGRWPFITHENMALQALPAVVIPPPPPPRLWMDGAGPVENPGPAPTATGQSRTHSMAEASANLVIGFVGSLLVTAYLLPHIGIQISTQQNFGMTAIFTVLSLLRAYFVRRLFNRLHSQKGA